MKKTIKIDVLTLIGMAFLVAGLILSLVFYYSYQETNCILDPVSYANNNSDDYWWDYAQAFKFGYKK